MLRPSPRLRPQPQRRSTRADATRRAVGARQRRLVGFSRGRQQPARAIGIEMAEAQTLRSRATGAEGRGDNRDRRARLVRHSGQALRQNSIMAFWRGFATSLRGGSLRCSDSAARRERLGSFAINCRWLSRTPGISRRVGRMHRFRPAAREGSPCVRQLVLQHRHRQILDLGTARRALVGFALVHRSLLGSCACIFQ
jgi:hypothetical protein